MLNIKDIDFWINFSANILTVIVSAIAIFVYLFNREKVASALNFILNYSTQLTLADLRFKIERLNDYNANLPEQNIEVVNILHEIEGQILGNKFLKEQLNEQLLKVSVFTTKNKSIAEPKKRSLVSELRESVRNLDANNFIKNSTNG